jgi:mono/diheme cytochrome c family protein
VVNGRSLAGATAVVALTLICGVPALGKGSRAGVYSSAQADEGARVYAAQCAMCHGARLEGTVETPGLVGKFVANWADRPLGDLFDYLARAMPQNSPGRLTPQDNARLLAFILRANGAPSGDAPLPADAAALRRIAFNPASLES